MSGQSPWLCKWLPEPYVSCPEGQPSKWKDWSASTLGSQFCSHSGKSRPFMRSVLSTSPFSRVLNSIRCVKCHFVTLFVLRLHSFPLLTKLSNVLPFQGGFGYYSILFDLFFFFSRINPSVISVVSSLTLLFYILLSSFNSRIVEFPKPCIGTIDLLEL